MAVDEYRRYLQELLLERAQRDELADIVEQTNHNIDLLVRGVNAFLEKDRERSEEIQQFRLETEQYKRENDRRFNTLLEEVRFLIRQLSENR
jgi:phosphoglycolate phosphatase-like HAD superfamily hydrolase